ncbi:MAG: hypothetical protein K2L16_04205 [Muribaculaceae bacterium]|nr:hypothetical protein [Muribaculaceae bacterium]
MNKKSVLMCVLTLLTVAYVAFAIPVTWRMAEADTMTGMDIRLSDPSSRFITAADIARECGIDPDTIGRVRRRGFDLYDLETRLAASDKIQHVNANILTDGSLRLEVTPMVPVARVFEPGQPSYYINATGKRISAELRYHLDVPVLIGRFDSVHPAARLLPLLDYIAATPEAGALVGTVTQEADGNIIIVPTVVGHVVNFGDTSMVTDKFRRLKTFYRKVLPTVGWTHYDTIAVKWRGQIVATRRERAPSAPTLITIEEQTGILDNLDNGTMEVPDSLDIVSSPEAA